MEMRGWFKPEIFPLLTRIDDFLPSHGFLEFSTARPHFAEDTGVILSFDDLESLAHETLLKVVYNARDCHGSISEDSQTR